jgi:hypothetical protein
MLSAALGTLSTTYKVRTRLGVLLRLSVRRASMALALDFEAWRWLRWVASMVYIGFRGWR